MKLITEVNENIEVLNEADENGNKNYKIRGVFMEAERKNRNGRVYPKSVLVREVNKYQEKIAGNRAYGELDHPCFWDKTEALTKQGWKLIRDVSEDDYVMTINTTTKNSEWQKVDAVQAHPYDGKLLHFKNRTIDTYVTPNHKFVVEDRDGSIDLMKAQDIYDKWKNDESSIEDHSLFTVDENDEKKIDISEVDWKDNVYCLTTENKTFLARDNGYAFWTGNSTPTINMQNVSHMITSLKEDGNNFVGEAKIIDTPNGRTVKALLDAGAGLGVSSRGIGSLKGSRNGNMVQEDYRLFTPADIVADPSAHEAFVQGVMEGVDWVYDDLRGWVAEDIKDDIEEAIRTREFNEEFAMKQLQRYMNSLVENY